MCGITGFMASGPGWSPDSLSETVARMSDRLRHRGPDDSGLWVDAEVSLALGHRRLSIIDLSPHGHQPMVSASGRWVLVYNGEMYNADELRSESDSYPYRGTSDTEVMLACFERYGIESSLTRFNGMFAFAAWDRKERVLHLACDRFGEKPLYYGFAGRTLLFGSELKALRSFPDFDTTINRNVIPLFMRYNYVPKPYSIYRDARRLEPGTFLSFRWPVEATYPDPKTFWSAREAALTAIRNPFQGTAEEAVTELERLLGDSVRRRMISDVPLGAFLSGGIDSTTVAALMQKYGSQKARTFTIGFSEEWYNEANEARAIARHLGTEHTELHVTPEAAMAVIPRLSTIYDEPFADSSQVPTFLVSELARRHVTVALSGDGGDEIFGGYNRYVWAGQVWNWIRRYPKWTRSAVAHLCSSISPGTWNRWSSLVPGGINHILPGNKIHKLAGILDVATEEEMYHRLISQWPDPESVSLGATELPTNITDPSNWNATDTLSQRMMLLDAIAYLPNDILVKVDRAAMAVGLETRTPYLDHRLFEFAWSLPDEWRIRGSESKWLLRQVLYRQVPKGMMERPKAGFGIPIDLWLRGPLRDWAEDLLDERRLRQEGFLDSQRIKQKWKEHLSGAYNWCSPLWGVLMFEAWLRTSSEVPEPMRDLTVNAA